MFMKRMENYNQAGDLTDILRASGSGESPPQPEWQFTNNQMNNYPPDPPEDFGHPFIQIRDPLLHDHIGSGFGDDEMKGRPPGIFSKMTQISPSNAKLQMPPPRGMLKGPMLLPNDHSLISSNGGSSSSLQISATSRNSGIKRRKSQAKKVVCIPAPAPVNSRPSGEVVPSDLWAWRKYGQKPIKGSPYPRYSVYKPNPPFKMNATRGYYRCSSSKGCPARKQVERSRTDPNMLVITYTSEHNHPWPTQRNALAGSTRTHQPSKNNAAKNTTNSEQATKKQASSKQEQKETSIENEANDTVVKEEIMEHEFEMNDVDIDSEFLKSYKPAFLEGSEDSFFADLGEIEPDPALDLLFTQGFSGGDHDPENKDLDPFSFYDWASGSNSTTTSCSEAKKDS